MGLKILLVQPIREGTSLQVMPDLGILYLGTALRAKGYDVKLLDCPKEKMTFAGFRKLLEEKRYDVVGVRCFSRDHNYVNHHLKIAKAVNPDTLTLTGGPHPSAVPEFVLNSMPALDFAWQGEAEESLATLLDLYQDQGPRMPAGELEKIPGLAWRDAESNTVRLNPLMYVPDLDAYGLPAWDMLEPLYYPGNIYKEHWPIVTTRGCPYPCTYCNTPRLSGRKLRHRSVDHVIAELKLLKSRYKATRFSLYDDEFTLNDKYTLALCQAMIDQGLNMKFDSLAGVRLDSLYPELLKVMEAAGCDMLAVGIESGNERVQKSIKKKVTVETIREQVRMTVGCSKIKITGYFMLGFLDETEEEILDTIKLALELPLHRANFNIVIPIPGTAIFNELVQLGRVRIEDINWDDCNCDQIAFKRDHVSDARLRQLRRSAYFRFFGRPRLLWQLGTAALRNPEIVRATLRKLPGLFARRPAEAAPPMYVREASVAETC